MELVVMVLFCGFVGVLIVLSVRGAREDEGEERRRVRKMLQEMPRQKADAWLRSPFLPGQRCACGMYNLKYTDTVKANEADHQAARCQPARERIEPQDNRG